MRLHKDMGGKKMNLKKIFLGLVVFTLASVSSSVALADMAEDRKPEEHMFFAEFDGKDDTSLWAKYNAGGNFQSYTSIGKVENGYLTTEPANTSFGRWGVFFGTGDAAYKVPATNKNIHFEIKFKVEGKIEDVTIWQMSGKRVDFGADDNIDFADMFIKNGKLACGDRTGVTVETDVKVELGKWYILKSRISFADRKVYTDIIDEAGNVKSYESGFTWGIGFENITQFNLHKNDKAGVKYVIDYVCLWDDSFGIKNISIEDGAEDVRIDTDIDLKFSGSINEESLENITLTDENGEIIETEKTANGSSVKVYIPYGLRYAKTYKFLVPNTVLSASGDAVSEKEITFKTEEKTFLIGDIKQNISGNKATSSVAIKNETSEDRTLYLLIMVYDENGTLVKMDNIKGVAEKNKETTISGELDISGLNATDIKAYIWNGVNVL